MPNSYSSAGGLRRWFQLPGFMLQLAFAGILSSWMLVLAQCAREHSAPWNRPQACLEVFLLADALLFSAIVGEYAAKFIGLGAKQWRRRRVISGVRECYIDRILYLSIGMTLAYLILACCGLDPALTICYPLQLTFVAELLIVCHVSIRAISRISRVRYLRDDYWTLFHPEASTERIERRRAYLRQHS